MKSPRASSQLDPTDTFARRHLGPRPSDVQVMLQQLGCGSLDELMDRTLPASIRMEGELQLEGERSESEFLAELRGIASQNEVLRSCIGQGYHGTLVPGVIQRNVLENPGWYTQYTPYQAEISQGRLEMLLNFQTMVADLTGMELANASLLDEGSAAAEALALCHRSLRGKRGTFFVSAECHPQTIEVVRTRASALGIELVVGDHNAFDFAGHSGKDVAGVLLQYPASTGSVEDYEALTQTIHAAGGLVVVACDLLALTLLRAPGDFGADVAVGTTQRFGVPMGFGGPHAAFFAVKEAHKRQVPGRIIGLSIDVHGNPALRMAMQTREQHIRREKATSNICTAQALLAIMAAFYALYHGPEGLKRIATRVHRMTQLLAGGLLGLGYEQLNSNYFDTLKIFTGSIGATNLHAAAVAAGYNLRRIDLDHVGLTLDETFGEDDVKALLEVFSALTHESLPLLPELSAESAYGFDSKFARQSDFLQHPVFSKYHSEHEMLRYIKRLESRDLSLTTSMIPLGSCTMKLNATSEMVPITWPEFGALHPFTPLEQIAGYRELFGRLESDLAEITGFDAVSLQPNAGATGEYAGLLAIRAWHVSRGDDHRKVVLIPTSAHGTNPASAILAGLKVVIVACDESGNIDVADLRLKAETHAESLAAFMVTYPSTHGVFELGIREICDIIHENGGQVYLDGANMNAQVGLCRPGDYGADVCHLNLHKTFAIPHGGGGPGVGPIGVRSHLTPFLPGDPLHPDTENPHAVGPVAATRWGSAGVLPISYSYIRLMGGTGLKRATQVAILNANYMALRLREHYPVLYSGAQGTVAHEFIIDLRPLEKKTGISGEDVAKRLMDYGFHAPTMSFPVAGTLMIEPTESESKEELDRLCDALILIRNEIRAVETGEMDPEDNALTNAPHTSAVVTADTWTHPYSRQSAAFPAPWTREHKFWPAVSRIDNGYGDRNLICTCPPIEAYADEAQDPAQAERVSSH